MPSPVSLSMRTLLSLVSLCVTRRGSLPGAQRLQRHAAIRRTGLYERDLRRAVLSRGPACPQPAPFQNWRGGFQCRGIFQWSRTGYRRDNPSACAGNCRTPWRKHRTAPAFLLSAGTAYFPQRDSTRHAPPSLSVKYAAPFLVRSTVMVSRAASPPSFSMTIAQIVRSRPRCFA